MDDLLQMPLFDFKYDDIVTAKIAPAALPPGKDPVPIVQVAGWASQPVWTGAENLAPTGIRSPDRSARSESLYRLSYHGLLFMDTYITGVLISP
jgi:hypothetical protein